ncbi:hypothetical protein [Actinokineospora sp. NBRC 105648]|uniref:hypothetical protein n=1 Tax=Actinokineospora sp. NBRC 105648 TaxID=3032206 RepID=UPI0024A0668F|nr:hypothetical protein [Actinokineospora sp. NBRC 105648]GLZ42271.1 hypothetical protein Acsp05_58950 [Actinokineospora sp. NBRC 105648]
MSSHPHDERPVVLSAHERQEFDRIADQFDGGSEHSAHPIRVVALALCAAALVVFGTLMGSLAFILLGAVTVPASIVVGRFVGGPR